MVRLVFGLVFGALLLVSRFAHADDDSFDAVKRRADEAAVGEHHEAALDLYDRAYKIEANPAILYNRARSLDALGRHVEAVEQMEAFLRDAPEDLKAKIPAAEILMRDLRTHVATLKLACNVVGATVKVRGESIGVTPLAKPYRFPAGRTVVEVVAAGYRAYSQTLQFAGGSESMLDVALEKETLQSKLVINTVPGATVLVDGENRGRAPMALDLASGAHVLRVTADGFTPSESRVVLAPGGSDSIDVRLEKAPSVLGRWWFWTSVAAVALGAGIVVYATTRERSPPSGDLQPGNIQTPLMRF